MPKIIDYSIVNKIYLLRKHNKGVYALGGGRSDKFYISNEDLFRLFVVEDAKLCIKDNPEVTSISTGLNAETLQKEVIEVNMLKGK